MLVMLYKPAGEPGRTDGGLQDSARHLRGRLRSHEAAAKALSREKGGPQKPFVGAY